MTKTTGEKEFYKCRRVCLQDKALNGEEKRSEPFKCTGSAGREKEGRNPERHPHQGGVLKEKDADQIYREGTPSTNAGARKEKKKRIS